MFAEQPHAIQLVFEFMIGKAISAIAMKYKVFAEEAVGAQVEAQAQAFERIGINPVLPGTYFVITDIEPAGKQ